MPDGMTRLPLLPISSTFSARSHEPPLAFAICNALIRQTKMSSKRERASVSYTHLTLPTICSV
eukprot:4812656-Lingulodinium_polyedra.AAC.1